MLPPSLFAPLDLHHAVEDVRRTQGAHGVVDLLVVTLTDRRVHSDEDIDEHLDTLKAACRQTRRYREAIPVFQRVATLNPERKHEMAVEIALAHRHAGDPAKALSVLESAVNQQHRLPSWRRSLSFGVLAEVAATMLGQPALAQECAALAQSTAMPARRRVTPLRPSVPAATAPVDTEAVVERTGNSGRPRLTLVTSAAA
jgi:hypothetical protein